MEIPNKTITNTAHFTSKGGKFLDNMKVIKWLLLCLICMIIIWLALLSYEVSQIQLRWTKDYSIIYIDENDILDGKAMIAPPEQYSHLLQIDLEMRQKVGEYMEKNNYKLKSGKQEFVRDNPTFEELVNDGFQFEKIEE